MTFQQVETSSRTRLSVNGLLLQLPGGERRDGERDRGEVRWREKGEGQKRDREDRENVEKKQQDPDKPMERVLDPAAGPGKEIQ